MMNNNKVMVSIVLPVYNGDKYIGQAIRSVLNQTFKDFELIIIDDASNDNTVKIINKFEDNRIKLKTLENNKGPSSARNIGLRIAQGKWLAFIDADDMWHKERLMKLLKVAKRYPNTFIGSDVMVCFSGKNNELIHWRSQLREQKTCSSYIAFPKLSDLVKSRFDVKPIFPQEIISKFSLKFNERFKGHEWLEIMLNFYRVGLYLIIVNEPLYYQRITPGSLSSSYQGISDELKMSKYIQSLSWIDETVKKVLKKNSKSTEYRLLTSAIREKRWRKSLYHIFQTPRSLLYLLHRYPQYILQKFQAKILYKKI